MKYLFIIIFTYVLQAWKKRSMFFGSWICLFKCSSKVRKNNEKFEPALRVYYPQRITFQLRNILEVWNSIMLFGKSARKQNKLQILLTWYEKHFTISNDKELNTVIQNSPLKYTWKTQNVPQFSKCSPGSGIPLFSMSVDNCINLSLFVFSLLDFSRF